MHFDDFSGQRLAAQMSGGRFRVLYRLSGDESAAREKAHDICVEQSVEFPIDLVPDGIRAHVVGRVESFEKESENVYAASISFADEIAGGELTQFLNVVFGNISIKRGIQVAAILPSPGILSFLNGPRLGIGGIRERVGVNVRPPVFTALKPMGLCAKEFARLAGLFALGGMDIIKDDHGLANQIFAPFEERVRLCADAVREANVKTGRSAIYVPNITAPAEALIARAHRAKELGAGGVLVSPGLVGLDAMRAVADSHLGLPIFAHPAFIGSYVLNSDGISSKALFGTIMRLCGADATIFPNHGGRFPLSKDECLGIVQSAKEELGSLKPIFPSPAGGMELQNIPDMLRHYGQDVLILIGGGLFRAGPDIVSNCKRFVDTVKEYTL